MRFWSAVTSTKSNTFAVAAIKWSAGSPCGKPSDETARATSIVSGASVSFRASMLEATQADTAPGILMRPFRCRKLSSQALIGEIHNSFCSAARSWATRFERRCGSTALHNQMCVSRSSFTERLPSHPNCQSAQQCHPGFLPCQPCIPGSFRRTFLETAGSLRLQVCRSA